MTDKNSKSFHHRSSLKQQNKPFKGGSNLSKPSGRTISANATTNSINKTSVLNKVDRRNRARMIKRARLEESKKNLNFDVKRMVVCVPLSTHSRFINIDECFGDTFSGNSQHSQTNTKKKGSAVKLVKAEGTAMQQLLRINSADVVLFIVHDSDTGVDQEGDQVMQLVKNQGTCTNALVVISDCNNDMVDTTTSNAYYNSVTASNNIKNSIKKQIKTKWAQEGQPCYLINDQKERQDLITFVTKHKLEHPVWRLNRPYLVPETVLVGAMNNDMCEMVVEGSVRGGGWKTKQIVHITGHGDYVCTLLDGEDEIASNDISLDEEMQEHMHSIYEPLQTEQEQQLDQDKKMALKGKRMVRVPEGTSAYQAAWMGNEEDSNVDSVCSVDENEDCEMDVDGQSNAQAFSDKDTEDEQIVSGEEDSESEIDEKLLKLIPDAVPLPTNQTVRERYAKYRGVDNTHTVNWTDVEVPLSASAVYQFADIRQSRKHALLEQEKHVVPGDRIRVSLVVPKMTAEQLQNHSPLPLWALLKHEEKPCWMNCIITPTSDLNADEDNRIEIKNKETAIALVDGFRLVSISPLYSEISPDPVHRRLRHLHEQPQCMLTFFGPVTMSPNAPILLLKEEMTKDMATTNEMKTNKLIAVGTLDNMLPRVILKGVVLTGRPFRIHKRSTTVRNLFYHPSDITYYKPVPLLTKSLSKNSNTGKSHRRVKGHIKDAVGERGKCRVVFERGIGMDDVIALELWKRIWPRWETRLWGNLLE